ncbi:MraZ protein [Marisediminitalea aggregata]|jgi:MraZ protein|uniref:Transcriptional regulator MraZ n=1 Tax=Marisediminitalea aggregata TaxID=634436 RepID=A0A1M5LLI2_9ALTE|nr:division/cell wall cluster transcriptional repressor MraZ [Marisediminitalea aggregata]MAX41813.1 transcriptional regulator MraZ [Alteromonadaceae bacterium]MCP3862563.1 division/cell wall cluster transcriptional repressor MraZ [Aestuariibacter sp.]MEC7468663.1 division/cell wall cluster transcriptional repressor MraZ [Pseudomonadota bacterium]BBO26700.1 transcriptional regulator MraZ [Alteromonas sp. I4]HBY38062.1 transcriptional regulator MraZ [Alteromonas sp.]|tara:strand:+ start:83 stop:541 length:459 start_codon:yes stop_codon:yes gene_type:complete
MFRGANAINLDSKGRLAIPTKYRQSLLDDCNGQLVCTIDTQQSCLLLYPLPEWEEIELKLSKFSSMIPSERRMQRLLLGYATECEMDKSGRVLLSLPLRKHATLDKEVMLVGQLNKLEIWDAETWATQIDADMEVERSGGFELTERLQDFSL